MPARLSFKCKCQRVDDLVANEVSDFALDFVKFEFPYKREDFDEFLELEVDSFVFVRLAESVLGIGVTFGQVPVKEFEQMLKVLDGKAFGVDFLVLLDLRFVETLDI